MEILERIGVFLLALFFLGIFSLFIYNSFLENNPILGEKEKIELEKLDRCEKFQTFFPQIEKEGEKYLIKSISALRQIISEILTKYKPCIDCDNEIKIFFLLERDFLILSEEIEENKEIRLKEPCIIYLDINELNFKDKFELLLALDTKTKFSENNYVFSPDFKEKIEKELPNNFYNNIKEKNILVKFEYDKKIKKVIYKGKTYYIQIPFLFWNSKIKPILSEPTKKITDFGFIYYIKETQQIINFKDLDSLKEIIYSSGMWFYVIPNYYFSIGTLENINKENLYNSLKEISKKLFEENLQEQKYFYFSQPYIEPTDIAKGYLITENAELIVKSLTITKYNHKDKKLDLGFFSNEDILFKLKEIRNILIYFLVEENNEKIEVVVFSFREHLQNLFNEKIIKEKREFFINNNKVLVLKMSNLLNLNEEKSISDLLSLNKRIEIKTLEIDYFYSFLNKEKWNFLIFKIESNKIKELIRENKLIIKKDEKIIKNIPEFIRENENKEIKIKKVTINNNKLEITVY